MKILTIVINVLALALIVFNFTKVNVEAPFKNDSIVALITILAALCAIVMMLILRVSKRIEEKVNQPR